METIGQVINMKKKILVVSACICMCSPEIFAQDEEVVPEDNDVEIRQYCDAYPSAFCNFIEDHGFIFTTMNCKLDSALRYTYGSEVLPSLSEELVEFRTIKELEDLDPPAGYDLAFSFLTKVGVGVANDFRANNVSEEFLADLLSKSEQSNMNVIMSGIKPKRETVQWILTQNISPNGSKLFEENDGVTFFDNYSDMATSLVTSKNADGIAFGMRAVTPEKFRYLEVEGMKITDANYPLQATVAVLVKSNQHEAAFSALNSIWNAQVGEIQIDSAVINGM